jgi:hypothetical protein
MTQLTNETSFKSVFGPRFLAMVVATIVLILVEAVCSHSALAQTQTNTFPPSGNAGVGTTSPQRSLTIYKTSAPVLQLVDSTSGSTADDGLLLFQSGLDSYVENSEAGNLFFRTNATNRVTINSSGNVGIGTNNPQNSLDASGSLLLRGNTTMASPTSVGPVFNAGYYAVGGYAFSQGFNYTTSAYTPFYLDGLKLILNANSTGNVGIGTPTPSASYKLDVNGAINASGNINSTGNITAAGSINAKYQDVAEWVPARRALPAGTVVTLDPTKSNHVEASSQAYDTRVAGVVSEQPGITLGERGENKVLVATTGRVRVTVDASHAPIHIGDLLVTSDVPGVAMKSEPILIGGRKMHSPGTLIGKALEPLERGSGKILVLLSLQ